MVTIHGRTANRDITEYYFKIIKLGSWLLFYIETSNILITSEALPSVRSSQRTLLL